MSTTVIQLAGVQLMMFESAMLAPMGSLAVSEAGELSSVQRVRYCVSLSVSRVLAGAVYNKVR